MSLIDPALVVPVGKLAIEVFFPDRPSLEQIVGTQHVHGGRVVIPLPHPSGASRWHQAAANRQLIQKAIELIAEHYDTIFRDDSHFQK